VEFNLTAQLLEQLSEEILAHDSVTVIQARLNFIAVLPPRLSQCRNLEVLQEASRWSLKDSWVDGGSAANKGRGKSKTQRTTTHEKEN